MKLAAIDIGSNSIHMIIARIDAEGNIEVVDRMKEMAQLGAETLTTGYLSEAAQERGIRTLTQFKALADAHRVDDIIAVATSATREARNGPEFIDRVREVCGIPARIIDGVQEGHLIYLGAREVYDFGSQRALLVDIGGGSVEFILADRRRAYLIKSLKLGVRRLKDRFLPEEQPSRESIDELVAHVRTKLDSIVPAIRRRGFDHVVTTSGTALALARLSATVRGEVAPTPPAVVLREHLQQVTELLLTLDPAARALLPGMEPKRLDTLCHGALLLRTLLEMFGAERFTICDGALREGMLVDYLDRHRPGLRLHEEVADPRRRSVLALMRRLVDAPGHSQHVAHLALRLFDQIQSVHRLPLPYRELLEYSALLHAVGRAIHSSGHHKHALYILRHADLNGFSSREVLLMANVVRYHRRSPPKARHIEFMELQPNDREVVKKLSALLRLANALDRGRQANVHKITCHIHADRIEIVAASHTDPSLEMSALRDHQPYVESIFGLPIRVRPFRPGRDAPAADSLEPEGQVP